MNGQNAPNACADNYHFLQKRYFSNRTKTPNFTDNCQAEYFDCLQDTFDSAVQYSNSIIIPIYLDANGITIKCPNANIGDTATVNGKVYEVVDNLTLKAKADNNEDVTCVCTSKVTDMTNLFKDKASFNQNIASWDTSSVSIMNGIFSNASIFNQNIGNWNTSNVTQMIFMFAGASLFNQDIGGWNTSNVNNMGSMFNSASSFNMNIGNWNTSSVKYMTDMFRNATTFNQNIGNWDTTNVLEMMASMLLHLTKILIIGMLVM